MIPESGAVFDVIVVGGGSAGCVLAARLSEDSSRRVLLLEAGPDVPSGTVPAAIASQYPGRAYFNQAWLWSGLSVTMGEGSGNRRAEPRPYEQARILGGGSSINGLGANRGAPSDYDEWVARGATGWGWSDVLPYFRKLENNRSFSGELHGSDGPLPISHIPRSKWSSYARSVEAVLAGAGHASLNDQNGAWRDGVIPTAINVDVDGHRAGVVAAYLTPQVRRRSNLAVATDVEVLRLLVEGGRCTGVEVAQGGMRKSFRAIQVVLSAGAIGSPTLLMRSGIGPGEQLRQCGITVQADVPGIGENLQEHPSIGVSGFLAPATRMPKGEHYHLPALLRWSSGMAGEPAGDMHTAIVARSGWHSVGRRIGSLFCWVNHSHSIGRVRLAADPDAPPDVDFRMLSDPRDLARLKQAFRLAVATLSDPGLANTVGEIFPSTYSAKIRRLLRPSMRNALLMGVAGPLMDASPRVRRAVLSAAIEGDADAQTLAADDALLESHLRRHVGGVWHPVGTCRMGADGDPMAVADPQARVRGVTGLRVCDGSLMPRIPCANTNIPIIMMAEKISSSMRRE